MHVQVPTNDDGSNFHVPIDSMKSFVNDEMMIIVFLLGGKILNWKMIRFHIAEEMIR